VLTELVDEYLAQQTAEANTLRTLRERLKYATAKFGGPRVHRLDATEIGAGRRGL
jgi:predicted chitinase